MYGALSSHRQTDPAKFVMPLFAPRLIYSAATVRGWWLPRWVSFPTARHSEGSDKQSSHHVVERTLTPPAIVRYSLNDFQEAARLADGEAGQEKVLPDFSERAP